MTIRILHDGKPAVTTAQFAALYGLSMDTARKTLSRLGVAPLPEMLDGRTKLYPAGPVAKAMKARPGRGANLRGRERRQPGPDLPCGRDRGVAMSRRRAPVRRWHVGDPLWLASLVVPRQVMI